MNQKPFSKLNLLNKTLRSCYKIQVFFKFLIDNVNWVLVYGPPRTGTSLLSRLLSFNSKFMIVDVGLHLVRKYPKASNWDSRLALKYYNKTYLNLLFQSHEGTWFYKKPFSRPIDLVIKQAALRVNDYELLCQFFGAPQRKIFCIREPSSYCISHLKKFNKPENVHNDYERAIAAYDKIGGEIVDYSSSLDLHAYEKILFGKVQNIPIKLKYKEYLQSESSLKPLYDEFKRKNKSLITKV